MSALIYKGDIPFDKFKSLLTNTQMNSSEIETLMGKLVIEAATKESSYDLAKKANIHVVEDRHNSCYKVTVCLP